MNIKSGLPHLPEDPDPDFPASGCLSGEQLEAARAAIRGGELNPQAAIAEVQRLLDRGSDGNRMG